jgi:hypothetical protein
MTKLLDKALEEVSQLPDAEQDIVAEFIISFIHTDAAEEQEWENMVRSQQSQDLLDELVGELKTEESAKGLSDFPAQ